MKKFKEYVFEDGYRCVVYGMSKNELAWEQLKHGKLIAVRSVE